MTAPVIDGLGVDEYIGDGQKDWVAFCNAGLPWIWAGFKATQGTHDRYDHYLQHERAAFLAAARPTGRYGVTLFEFVYHYLELGTDGAAQADYLLDAFEAAGGFHEGTLPCMVDVERGGQPTADLTRERIETVTRAFNERYFQRTGHRTIRYCGELMAEVGVTDEMGSQCSIIAQYGSRLGIGKLSTEDYLRLLGTSTKKLLAWQYCGDGEEYLPGFPDQAPGVGKSDIEVLTLPGLIPAVRQMVPHPARA